MTLPVTFANLPAGNNPASLLDQEFAAVAAMGTTYCSATGTNTILLTVQPNQPAVTGYAPGQRFSFVASATNTGPATIQVGALAAIPVHSAGAPLAPGVIVAGTVSEFVISAGGAAADLAIGFSGPVVATGGTTSRQVSDHFADIISTKDFGAFNDGNSHPLSATFATLAAAQAVFPVATALTDETDWCALQMAVNANLTAIRIVGNAVINKPVVSGTAMPVTVIGGGQYVSSITQTAAGQDGWQHNSANAFEMFGLNLQCNGVGGAALNVNISGTSGRFTLRDVRLAGNGPAATNYWHDGVKLVGCSRTTIDHCLIVGCSGALSGVGNGIYLAPQTLPAAAGSFVVRVEDTIINYWQSGIVLDSTGRTGGTNIQGAVFDWVNCNGCMQFVTILGSALEVVLHKCQYEGFGTAVSAAAAQTVVVRDCLFFFDPSNANAIAAQLPQNCIQINGGGNWWIRDTRFVLQASAVVLQIVNVTANAAGIVLRDNSVYVNTGAVASGFLNIDSGSHHVFESATVFSFWGAWPFVTNANSHGGVSNNAALAALVAAGALTVDQWQNQGAYVAFNYPAGTGATTFMASKGGGNTGGFNFYSAASDTVTTPYLIAQIQDITSSFGQNTGNYTLEINGGAGFGRNLQYQSGGVPRWVMYVDSAAESGGNNGSNLNIASYTDAGTLIGTALSFLRASNMVVVNSNTLAFGTAGGPSITSGAAAPASTQPKGSIYLRTGGAAGSTLYVSQGGGVWNAVAGV